MSWSYFKKTSTGIQPEEGPNSKKRRKKSLLSPMEMYPPSDHRSLEASFGLGVFTTRMRSLPSLSFLQL